MVTRWPASLRDVVSGYKKPELLGVLACGTASARPLVMGLLKGVLLIELAGTEILGLVA